MRDWTRMTRDEFDTHADLALIDLAAIPLAAAPGDQPDLLTVIAETDAGRRQD